MKYFYNLDEKDDIAIGPDYSSAHGGWVKGERLQVLLYHKPKGTGSRPHRHPNEQFIYILQGSVIARIEDQEKIARKGEVIHIPVNALHSMVATTEEDVVYYVAKDTTFGIHGIPEDGEKPAPTMNPVMRPKNNRDCPRSGTILQRTRLNPMWDILQSDMTERTNDGKET